jgi:electron transport complex protein RnfG
MSEQKLPMAGNDGSPPAAPPQVSASSARLIGTLGVAGALAGLGIVMAFQWANPRIEAYRAKVLAESVTEVLGGPDRYETVYVENGKLTDAPQGDTTTLDRVYVGYDASGKPRGVALEAEEAGFQDIITLIFGYDPASGDLLGMKVLGSKETPGLGDKIIKDSAFVQGFENVGTPLLGVKKGQGSGGHDEVVMITGATISSRAVIDIINHRLEALKGPVDSYWATLSGGSTPQGGGS